MQQDDLYITGSVIVRNGSFYKNGNLFWETKTDEEFLNNAYTNLGLNYPKFYKMDALGKLGILSSDLLLRDIPYQHYQPFETGIVLSNRHASIEADAKYFHSVSEIPSPALFVYTLPNIVIGEISIRYKFKGENAFFVKESFDPVRTTADGVVEFAGVKGGYGNCVIVRHKSGYETLYGHLSRILVKQNQKIETGYEIGKLGSTGRSTGPHLHYEVIKDGIKIDPARFTKL